MSAFGLSQADHDLVRSYVTGADHLQYSQLPEGVVAICLTHSNLTANHLDIRLDLHSTIESVKGKFKHHIGTPVEHQRLILKSHGRSTEMADNTKKLGFYSVISGDEIHVIDTDPFSLSRGGGLTDTSLVEKYKMSDEAYDKRKGTMRDYIREQRKLDPNFKLKPNAQAAAMNRRNADLAKSEGPAAPPPGLDSVAGIETGMRCEVNPGARRGTVMFVGEVEQIASGGHWVGVKFDEPLGHNDGTVKGVKIFEAAPGYGAFIRGKNITVGDFPEVGLDDLLDEDEDEI